MASRRSPRKRENDGAPEDWRRVLPAGGLIAAVLITLALGAALRTDSPAPAIESSPATPAIESNPAAPGVPAPSAAEPETRPASAPEDSPLDLDQRAAGDARRIRSSSAEWTLQFMLACDPVNIRPRIALLTDQPDFFLLPKQHDGQSCFRLCWGRFRSREQALATTDYPRALHEIEERPQALQIAKALP